jgi:uncharacterized protein YbjT (DUF2867 family)
MTLRTVLVTGATGRIGGAVIRDLIARGHRVRGLTRNPSSPTAERLARLGAEIFRGAYDDARSLARALEGIESVVAVGSAVSDTRLECRQGMALLDAAADSGVTHYVLVSAAGADRTPPPPALESKTFLERYLLASTLPYTIVGSTWLMENLLAGDLLAGLQQGALRMPVPALRRIQMAALVDVGVFCGLAVERRDAFLGRRFDVASDELSPVEAARVLSRVTRHPIEFQQQAPSADDESARPVFEWLEQHGSIADIANLRREYPQVGWHTFESWANTLDWSLLDMPSMARAG